MPLFPDQQAALDGLRASYRAGFRAPLLVAATSWGKTYVSIEILRGIVARGKTGWWIEHRKELIAQSSAAFDTADIVHSIVGEGRITDASAKIQIASVQTLAGRMHELPPPDIIIFDEAHHCAAASWESIIERYPDTLRMGVTATPVRLDGRGLGKYFDCMVKAPSISRLIAMGRLAPYRLFVAPAELSGIGMRKIGGDYSSSALFSAAEKKPKRVGNIVDHYSRICPGTRAICFAINIADSMQIARKFNDAGISAAHIDGTTPGRERLFSEFADGKISVMSNVELFGEGVHVDGVGCIIHARPTASLARFMQWNGRGFKYKPDGSPLYILDHSGNSGKFSSSGFMPNHGMPDDIRDWSLKDEKNKKTKVQSNISIKLCPMCYAAVSAQKKICYCGHEFKSVTELPKFYGGELYEITKELSAGQSKKPDPSISRRARISEEYACSSIEQMVRLGESRGYQRGWAFRRWEMINNRKRSS